MCINVSLKSLAAELSAATALASSPMGTEDDWKAVREIRNTMRKKREEMEVIQHSVANEPATKRIKSFIDECVGIREQKTPTTPSTSHTVPSTVANKSMRSTGSSVSEFSNHE